MAGPVLEAKNLTKHFPVKQGVFFSRQVGAVRAVDDISFTIDPGKTLGLVGESGCGKTDRKSTRLNSSHQIISYAAFCLKKKPTKYRPNSPPQPMKRTPTTRPT